MINVEEVTIEEDDDDTRWGLIAFLIVFFALLIAAAVVVFIYYRKDPKAFKERFCKCKSKSQAVKIEDNGNLSNVALAENIDKSDRQFVQNYQTDVKEHKVNKSHDSDSSSSSKKSKKSHSGSDEEKGSNHMLASANTANNIADMIIPAKTGFE